jgi:hypothetical protein
MNNTQLQAYAAEQPAGNQLADAISAYIAAKSAQTAAQTAFTQSESALNQAWSNFVTKHGDFGSAVMVAPPGYTPPA